MDKNFWTEDNQIMNYDDLFRIDLQHKLMKMENQIVCGKDIADLCYNYDYFISDKNKATQFIADYSEHFVKSLNQYKNSVGKPFKGATNPLKMATLMALYKSREILLECETVKKNWDRRMTLDLEMLNAIFQEMEEGIQKNRERLTPKVLFVKETLAQTSTDHICNHLQNMVKENITVEEAIRRLEKPVISERSAMSIIKNDYTNVVEAVNECDARTHNVKTLMEDVIMFESKKLFDKEFAMSNKTVSLTYELVMAIKNALTKLLPKEIELKPLKNVRNIQRADSVKESQRAVREK